jgi:heterodisulfide reductase subunit A
LAKKSVLVVGGGIAGVASSLKLASNGFKVYLVEREPTIGGQALSFCCKAAEACSQCSVCLVPEKIAEVKAQSQISLLTNSEVVEISGKAGDFSIRLIRKPRFVDIEKCTACGICAELCPSQPTKGIYLPSPQALPYAYAIDKNNCLHFNGVGCNICSEKCPFGAIDFNQSPQRIELSVDAIIAATGFDVFDAKEKGCLGYGRYSNVLTGFDLERKFSKDGSIKLPSNGEVPQNVAFIQCVGSRDAHIGNGYCSQVCCKYAMRFAKLLQYQHPETKITIFYMDLQTAGKGFGEFYQQCKETIRFVRGIPVEISEIFPDELEVKYEDFIEGKVAKEIFDLVVLSVGITPRKDSSNIARILGINLADWGFFDTQYPLDGTETNVEGIFVAGTCHGPKDIPESITHGVQAASQVIQTLAARGI